MPRIILASSSPRRQELMTKLGLTFEIKAAAVDESVPEKTGAFAPAELVEVLALRKARAVAEEPGKAGKAGNAGNAGNGALVIGADTVVVHRGTVLGKPADAEEARAMLRQLQGTAHEVFTGLAVVRVIPGKVREAVAHERTLVKFRPVDEWEIERYVATGEPLDKAGSYAIQGLGAIFVEGIEGCFFNVVGLPLARLAKMLRSFGVNIII